VAFFPKTLRERGYMYHTSDPSLSPPGLYYYCFIIDLYYCIITKRSWHTSEIFNNGQDILDILLKNKSCKLHVILRIQLVHSHTQSFKIMLSADGIAYNDTAIFSTNLAQNKRGVW
jgi:hypothetical protein